MHPLPPGRRGAALLLLALLAGCGGDPNRVAVSGAVTLDGQPLEAGRISFVPIEGTKSPSAGDAIAAGRYAIPQDKGPAPGAYRVEIRATRKTGKKIPAGSPAPAGTMVDEVVEAVPAQYNTKSTLRADLKAGANPVDFAVTSK